jgi:hypothetical protein
MTIILNDVFILVVKLQTNCMLIAQDKWSLGSPSPKFFIIIHYPNSMNNLGEF